MVLCVFLTVPPSLCPAFQSYLPSKKTTPKGVVFLAGALGLEPRAYGFGDDADKSASGGTTSDVNISTIQKQIAAVFAKTDQKRN